MNQLSKSEEILMEIIWKKENVFLKEILEEYTEPKPAKTTIATLLKRMQEKKFVGYKLYGNSRSYFPMVKKSKYFLKQVNAMISNSFENSTFQFASFFTKETDLSRKELEELKEIINQEIEKKK